MYSLEPVKYVVANEVRRSPLKAIQRKWRLRIGEWLAWFVEPVLQHHEFARLHRIQHARATRNGERLSEQQFLELQEFQETAMDIEARRQYFRNSDHTKTMHGIAPPLIETVLRQDRTVRTVLNIGCNYAYMDHVMASRHPEIQFLGIDAPRSLEEVNADLALPNLKIYSGYALDYLESGQLRPDLCYFSSTATVIRNAELKAYFRQLAKTAKYLVLSEPIYPSRSLVFDEGYYDNPDDIGADESFPTFLQTHFASNKRGYLSYLHNYRAIAEQCGFETLHHRVFVPTFTTQHWIEFIGRSRNTASPQEGGPAGPGTEPR